MLKSNLKESQRTVTISFFWLNKLLVPVSRSVAEVFLRWFLVVTVCFWQRIQNPFWFRPSFNIASPYRVNQLSANFRFTPPQFLLSRDRTLALWLCGLTSGFPYGTLLLDAPLFAVSSVPPHTWAIIQKVAQLGWHGIVTDAIFVLITP